MGLVAEFTGLRPGKPTAVTVGRFDGVHKGHQYLLSQLRQEADAREAMSVAIPLYPDPRVVHEPGFQALYVEALEERLEVLSEHVDLVVLVNYTWQLSRLSAREFVTSLIEDLNLTCLVAGPNHTLGRDKLGTIPVLRELGEELGFEVVVVEPVALGQEMVSSTLVREAVATGDIPKATRMLGRAFALVGPVVSGAGRGRTLGYPTANLAIEAQIILPADGIYATRAFLDADAMPSVTSVGRRPTFENGERLVEVHLLDNNLDLYGKTLRVEFLERIRDERRFDSVEALVAQMADDVESARLALAKAG
jgi:riboflavin kinase/FMN adenylyltransferase